MKNDEIKALTPKQLALHPSIQKMGEALRRMNRFHEHKSGCDDDGMDTCPCGHTELVSSARDIGIEG